MFSLRRPAQGSTLGVFPKEDPLNTYVSLRKKYGSRWRERCREKERDYYFGRVFSKVVKVMNNKSPPNERCWGIYSLGFAPKGRMLISTIGGQTIIIPLQHPTSLLVINSDPPLT